MPKSARAGALAEIWNAEHRNHARRAVAAFKLAYGAKLGKAVAKIVDDLDELLAFYDFPAEHWVRRAQMHRGKLVERPAAELVTTDTAAA